MRSEAQMEASRKLGEAAKHRNAYAKELISKIEWRENGAYAKGFSHGHIIVVSRFRNHNGRSLRQFAWEIKETNGMPVFSSGFEEGASCTMNAAKIKAVSQLDYFVKARDKTVSIDYLAINKWPDK